MHRSPSAADLERTPPSWPHPLLAPVGLFALAVLSVGQLLVVHAAAFEAAHRPLRWSIMIRAGVVNLIVWALLFFVVRGIIRRYPLVGDRLRARLAFHGVASMATATLHALCYLVGIGAASGGDLLESMQYILTRRLYLDGFIYWALLCSDWAARVWRRERLHALRTTELERSLAEARLLVLRGQLQPHFLFNTLHAVSALMHRDVEAADRVLSQLAELLRASLRSLTTPEISLREELLLLNPFLEIARIRFQDRLMIDIEVSDELDEVRVPALLLQPLVENALRHGVGRRVAGGRIWVSARRNADALELRVEDDGVGVVESAPEGIGLGSIRARLARLYPGANRLVLTARPGGGARVEVSLPWRATAPAEA